MELIDEWNWKRLDHRFAQNAAMAYRSIWDTLDEKFGNVCVTRLFRQLEEMANRYSPVLETPETFKHKLMRQLKTEYMLSFREVPQLAVMDWLMHQPLLKLLRRHTHGMRQIQGMNRKIAQHVEKMAKVSSSAPDPEWVQSLKSQLTELSKVMEHQTLILACLDYKVDDIQRLNIRTKIAICRLTKTSVKVFNSLLLVRYSITSFADSSEEDVSNRQLVDMSVNDNIEKAAHVCHGDRERPADPDISQVEDVSSQIEGPDITAELSPESRRRSSGVGPKDDTRDPPIVRNSPKTAHNTQRPENAQGKAVSDKEEDSPTTCVCNSPQCPLPLSKVRVIHVKPLYNEDSHDSAEFETKRTIMTVRNMTPVDEDIDPKDIDLDVLYPAGGCLDVDPTGGVVPLTGGDVDVDPKRKDGDALVEVTMTANFPKTTTHAQLPENCLRTEFSNNTSVGDSNARVRVVKVKPLCSDQSHDSENMGRRQTQISDSYPTSGNFNPKEVEDTLATKVDENTEHSEWSEGLASGEEVKEENAMNGDLYVDPTVRRNRESPLDMITPSPPESPAPGARPVSQQYEVYVRVVKPYKAKNKNQLTLKVGQIVKQKTPAYSDGLAYGWTKNHWYSFKRRGFYPVDCVELKPRDNNRD